MNIIGKFIKGKFCKYKEKILEGYPMNRLISILVLCVCGVSSLSAQSLSFGKKTIDMGILSEDEEPVTFHFSYINESPHVVKIVKVQTTCGCARPHFKQGKIQPGEKGKISVTFYPLGRPGDVHKSIFVYTDTLQSSVPIELRLTGNVTPSTDPYINYPYAIGPLRLMQSGVHFHKVRASQRHMESIEVVNSGNNALVLSTCGLPSYITFSTLPSPIPAKAKADLMFIIHPDKMSNKGDFKFDFLLEGVGDVPQLQRTMTVKGRLE